MGEIKILIALNEMKNIYTPAYPLSLSGRNKHSPEQPQGARLQKALKGPEYAVNIWNKKRETS